MKVTKKENTKPKTGVKCAKECLECEVWSNIKTRMN